MKDSVTMTLLYDYYGELLTANLHLVKPGMKSKHCSKILRRRSAAWPARPRCTRLWSRSVPPPGGWRRPRMAASGLWPERFSGPQRP